MNILRPIAIYLPQFHPIPENDEWWGKGFTEWTNVTKSKPLFEGHYQPHLPSDLGFYDLRVPEVREEQARLANEYGIYGFCYYHYWFNGRRILERPFQEVYESGKPDFPFMLCWANENWTRAWDGQDKEVLLKQNYSDEDDRVHIKSLIPYFKDDRYIRVDGKPVMCIYRSVLLPDAKRTTTIWREEAKKEGLELYLCRFETFGLSGKEHLVKGGFDAAVDFQPLGKTFNSFQQGQRDAQEHRSLIDRIKSRTKWNYLKFFNKEKYERLLHMQWRVWDYEEYIDHLMQQPFPDYNLFPGICPAWDNYARRKKNYLIFKNSSPQAYKKWLSYIVKNYKPKSREENFIFINAWNEWAEGNHLEPCEKWGRQYLDATKAILVNID
jgi:lipopolysaccharide biosynthesis protein